MKRQLRGLKITQGADAAAPWLNVIFNVNRKGIITHANAKEVANGDLSKLR